MGAKESFDAYKAERSELDMLIGNGVDFTTPKRSIFRFLGKKQRTWKIRQPYLGTLDHLSAVYIEMGFDEDMIKSDPMQEAKKIARRTLFLCAKAVAISVLNSGWKIKALSGLLARYFYWRLQPSKLFQIAILINNISNFGDFINSIRLMSASRTTAPKRDLVEKEKTKQEDSEVLTETEDKS